MTVLPPRSRTVRWRALALFLALPLSLAACSHDETPAAAPPASAYAAVALGKVDVEGGLLALAMPSEGTLAEVDVHEGDRVRRGQPLAALDLQPATLAVDAAQADRRQAQANLRLLGSKLAAARLRARRLAAAAKAGAGDGQSADDARDAADQLAAELDTAHAAMTLADTRLAQARYALAQRTLHSPVDADVVHVAAQPGASVSPQSGPVFTLLPRTPRIVRAELSEAYLHAVKAGSRADVSTDQTGARHWSAHVLRVGRVIGPSQLEDDPQLRANTRTVECVLAFDQPTDLRVGQRVLVRFAPDAAAKPAVAAQAPPAKD